MRASPLWNHPDLGLGRVWKRVAERGRVKGNGNTCTHPMVKFGREMRGPGRLEV